MKRALDGSDNKTLSINVELSSVFCARCLAVPDLKLTLNAQRPVIKNIQRQSRSARPAQQSQIGPGSPTTCANARSHCLGPTGCCRRPSSAFTGHPSLTRRSSTSQSSQICKAESLLCSHGCFRRNVCRSALKQRYVIKEAAHETEPAALAVPSCHVWRSVKHPYFRS